MRLSKLQFFPLAWPFLILLFFLFAVVIAFVELGILQYAYQKIGIGRHYVFAIWLFSLLGSYINIPVARLPAKGILYNQEISFFGMRWAIPHMEEVPQTVVALNLGGAIIPALVSFYLLIKNAMYARELLGVLIVAAVVHKLARPIAGLGIVVPIFVPPLLAAGTALLLCPQTAPPCAYVAGTLGTLIGADLLNLRKVQDLRTPIISIGGAGTFDGIFLIGILAVLLS